MKIVAKNKKAFFDYEILEKYEAGVVLSGAEVKSIRAGRVNLKDSFIKIVKGEAFLFHAHISHLQTTHAFFKPNERRERKLLLHRKEIDRLLGKITMDGLTLVPLVLYFNKRNKVKIEIALAKGKNLHDKRETLKRKILDREAQMALKNYR